jgi:APA family basic amino acid/polyamine antiporter
MGLKRVLGAVDTGWLVAGNMIGAGIFITPGLVAGHLPGIAWPLCAWLLGGLLALCGAAVYGELGCRLPRAGGDYQYLATAFGPFWGFLTGWAAITLTFSAAAAVMARVSMDYLTGVWPFLQSVPGGMQAAGAPLVIMLLTLTNTAGARVAGKTIALFTAIPIAGLLGMLVFGWGSGQGADASADIFASPAAAWPLALGAALIPVYFTYSGWNAAAYLAGEIRDPGRNLSRALLGGTALVMVVYLLVNLSLMILLSPHGLSASTKPAADAARQVLGHTGEGVLGLMIAVAIIGSANVTLMAGARIYYAMALDDLAPQALTRTNRSGVPSTALWVSGVWTALLSALGDVAVLVGWATLAILLLSSATVATLFVFRRRAREDPAFRCPGYPLTPIIYLLASLGVAVASTVSDPRRSLIGLAVLAAGVPVYQLARRRFRGTHLAR